jgi:hypothetical protein
MAVDLKGEEARLCGEKLSKLATIPTKKSRKIRKGILGFASRSRVLISQEFTHDRHNLIFVNGSVDSGEMSEAGCRNSANKRIVMSGEHKALTLRPTSIRFERRNAHKGTTDCIATVAGEQLLCLIPIDRFYLLVFHG